MRSPLSEAKWLSRAPSSAARKARRPENHASLSIESLEVRRLLTATSLLSSDPALVTQAIAAGPTASPAFHAIPTNGPVASPNIGAALAGPPAITPATIAENHQTTSGLVITPAAADAPVVANYLITGITHGSLFLNDGTTAVSNGSMITLAQGVAGLKFTPATNFVGQASFTAQESSDATPADANGATAAAAITVTPAVLAGPPAVTAANAAGTHQTTSGLVITPAAADGSLVTNYLITNITHGSLFLNDGTTAVSNGTMITLAQGAAGLKFTAAASFVGQANFTVQQSPDANAADASGTTATAAVTVNLNGPPSVIPAVIGENHQTTAGLVITAAAADGALVTNYLITNITHGTLFQSDGTTAISSGSMITVAQGTAGLKFTPDTNFVGQANFTVQEAPDANPADASGTTATAAITVTPAVLAGPPAITPATIGENHQTTSGLVITPAAADAALVTNYLITNITHGSLFLNDGTTAVSNGTMITLAQGAAGLKFTPDTNFVGQASFTVQQSPDANVADASGTTAVAAVTVTPAVLTGPPAITPATTTGTQQTTSGLVITPAAADGTLVTNYLITNITHGSLFLNDGVTAISNGSMITLAQGAAGLKFTPAASFVGQASFTVQQSPDANAADASGTTATGLVTVNLTGPPSVTSAVAGENHQTTSGLVILPSATEAAFVTNFQITNITGGTLFQHDGTTAINSGDFITLAQGAAGLKFTPTTGSTVTGSFTVQESTTANVGGLGGATATATIIVVPSFVIALYQDVLLRPFDDAGGAYYANLLATGTAPETIAAAFWESAEHRGIEVDGYYQQFLHRPADASGRAMWVNDLLAGQGEVAVMTGFVSSLEYQQLHPTTTQFVTALYNDVLHRAPDVVGLSDWVTMLTNQNLTQLQVIQNFMSSHERHQQLIDSFYSSFLQRPADFGELGWISLLDHALVDDQFMAEAFLSSQEFIIKNPI
jgi:hypothetical protein